MSETKQMERPSLIEQMRQTAGAADMEPAPQHRQPPVILPDGYRRRSPVQFHARRPRRISRRVVALLGFLSAVLLAVITVWIIRR